MHRGRGSLIFTLEQARALLSQGKLDAARAAYESILVDDPDEFEALHNLAIIHAQAGKLSEAEQLIRRALVAHSSQALAHVTLGNVLQLTGRNRQALACYREALHVQPGCVEAHGNLARAAANLGELDLAVQH